MKNLKPLGIYVLLRFEAVKDLLKTKGGLFIVEQSGDGQGSKKKYAAYVHSIGNKVDMNSWDFVIDDKVVFNDYDMKIIEDEDNNRWGLLKPENIMAVYED